MGKSDYKKIKNRQDNIKENRGRLDSFYEQDSFLGRKNKKKKKKGKEERT